MAEQLAVELDVKNVTEFDVKNVTEQDKPIYFVWILEVQGPMGRREEKCVSICQILRN